MSLFRTIALQEFRFGSATDLEATPFHLTNPAPVALRAHRVSGNRCCRPAIPK